MPADPFPEKEACRAPAASFRFLHPLFPPVASARPRLARKEGIAFLLVLLGNPFKVPAKLVAQLRERTRGRFVIGFQLLDALVPQLLQAPQRADMG